ncbi:M17 family metallopeptidase [Kordiimonas sp. SCSIO 12603]|uniref:leucyl aminopeptidase family protein n=1 Tax=Kordiimonas sp. SCSIO 12603 TaxID=2829596 RepID=UPI002103C723|nr:leucyl aminopeptidase family protein [Kordiimonas sp. SCSIO 12603]
MFDFTAFLGTDSDTQSAVSLTLVDNGAFTKGLSGLSATELNWCKANGFSGKAGEQLAVANTEGELTKVLVGTGDGISDDDPWWLAAVAEKLEDGTYRVEGKASETALSQGALGWCLAQHSFTKYLDKAEKSAKKLLLPEGIDIKFIAAEASAMATVRDLVNTPTEDMGPAHLQDTVEALAEQYGATCSTIVGDDLLEENFPAIHAVGRAASEGRAPRLIDLQWGEEDAPKLTLVGKGVCFDTGGLDVKPSAGMRLMKKDMGGAAHTIGLAQLIMAAGLKVRLRLLIPAVENALSGNAYRPGDVIDTRKGLTVEIHNTDAEGRVVLCDAIALASEENPDLMLDFATLTGAARVALGQDLPATYTNDDSVWSALEQGAKETGDPLWRMPLWAPYNDMFSSRIADMSNCAESGFGGSITAALYLQKFVGENIPWVHFDVYAWSQSTKPGRPHGGAAQGIRASFKAINTILTLDD